MNKKIYNRIKILFIIQFFYLINCLSVFADSSTIYTIDISSLNEEEVAAVAVLQGLANREKPQIMIEPKDKGCFHGSGYRFEDENLQRDGLIAISQATLDKYPALEDVFKEYYGKTYNCTFQETGFDELFTAFSSLYNGTVKYAALTGTAGIAVAATVCGIEDAIPVTNNLLDKHPLLKEKTLLVDLTTKGFRNKLAAHRWAVNEYLSRTSAEAAYSFWNGERCLYSLDYAISKRLFSFYLSYADSNIHTDGGQSFPYDNDEAALLNEIFAHLNPGSSIIGWGDPNEYVLQARCGEVGHALICSNASPNMSLHAVFPANVTSFKQIRNLNENDATLENKIYITFSISEGDTYKSIGNLMQGGTWLHDKRGIIPFNWPVNPRILQLLPALGRFYYENMTENDYFYMPTSGIGYFDAGHSTAEARLIYAQKNREAAEFTDMHYMDIWWNSVPEKDKWIQSMGVKGYTEWTSSQFVDYGGVIPRISSDMYYDLYMPPTKRIPFNMAKYIKQQTSSVSNDSPWFIHVYACDPTFAAEVMKNLPSERFKAVCMDEFFILAEKAKSKISGKYINKNNELINQLINETEVYRFEDDFNTPSRWETVGAKYEIKDGEMMITPDGTSYYSLITKQDNKFDTNNYPLLAARVTQFPPNNVDWYMKLFDGMRDIPMKVTNNAVEGFPDIYVWNMKEATGWGTIHTSNLQLVLETASSDDMQGFQMKYDWVKTFESMEQLFSELGSSGLKNIAGETGDSYVIDTKYYTLQGVEIQHPAEIGVYIVRKIYQSRKEEITKLILNKK
ncbi:hypothetical protein FACS189413_02230 [Bacteroidia bacterium]|nr:hypothetical protein FACS189413_02230 [Bacteroidia bacterium]